MDIRYATPSGPYGRIIEQDILALRDAVHMLTSAAQSAAAAGIASGVSGTGLGGRITTGDLQVPVSAGAPATATIEQAGGSSEDWLVLNPQYDEVKVSNIRKVIAKAMHINLYNSTAYIKQFL